MLNGSSKDAAWPGPEAVFKEKHGVWGPYARVDYNSSYLIESVYQWLASLDYTSPYLIESVYQWLARQESRKPMDTALMDTFDLWELCLNKCHPY